MASGFAFSLKQTNKLHSYSVSLPPQSGSMGRPVPLTALCAGVVAALCVCPVSPAPDMALVGGSISLV